MKKTILLFSFLLIIFSCNKKSDTNNFTINGIAKNAEEDSKIMLIEAKGNQKIILDSTRIKNGKFTFSVLKSINPKLAAISLNNLRATIPVIISDSDFNVEFDAKEKITSKTFGNKDNELFQDLKDNIFEFIEKQQELNLEMRKKMDAKDTLGQKTLTEEFTKYRDAHTEYLKSFLKNNKESYVAGLALERLTESGAFTLKEKQQEYEKLADTYKSSARGTELKSKLYQKINPVKTEGSIEIGKPAPNFSGESPDGKTIALKDVVENNKLTLIDFWASWCGPCRKENPNVVKLYNEMKGKGFEILGVSLDGIAGRQKQPKQSWINAIKQDKITWQQVSNLKGWQEPIARLYNVRGIPATFLVDSKGVIVGKNLRGKDLENKVKELLK